MANGGATPVGAYRVGWAAKGVPNGDTPPGMGDMATCPKADEPGMGPGAVVLPKAGLDMLTDCPNGDAGRDAACPNVDWPKEGVSRDAVCPNVDWPNADTAGDAVCPNVVWPKVGAAEAVCPNAA